MLQSRKFKRVISLICVFAMITAFAAYTGAAAEELPAVLASVTFDDPSDASLFSPNTSGFVVIEGVSNFGRGDNNSLKVVKQKSEGYTSIENAVNMTMAEPLELGAKYSFTAYFYVPSADNAGKGTLTGPGIVLNGDSGDGNSKFPGSPGTIALDTWRELTVEFTVQSRAVSFISLRFVVNDAPNHPDVWYIDDVKIVKLEEAPEPDPDEPDPGEGRLGWLEVDSLKDAYASKFKVGNIMSPAQLSDTDLVDAFTHHFNVVTAENHMKPNQLSSAKGTYSFTQADTLVNWAQSNDLDIHAHTLVWHSQSPNWLYRDSNGDPLPRAEAKANMEEYINTVAGHFAGKVVTWDVVNEALYEGSWSASAGWQNNLRTDSPWYLAYSNGMAEGETPGDYIYDAFVFTRLADPNAILLYNDYNDHLNPRRSAIVAMANDLNARWKTDERNTDVDRPLIEGVGMQAHYWVDEYSSLINNVRTALTGYTNAGLKIYITELDIPAGGSTSSWGTRTATDEDKERQPVMYGNLFSLLQEFDAIERVTFWGMKDDLSWRGPNGTGLAEPLIFDNKRRAKPNYDAIMEVKPEPVVESTVITFDNPSDTDLFTPNTNGFVVLEGVSDFGREDNYSLKVVKQKSEGYTSIENAVNMAIKEPLELGAQYSFTAYFYVPSADNAGKGTLTGPGIVLNGDSGDGNSKFPGNPGTIGLDTWRELSVEFTVQSRAVNFISLRFVVNDAPNHPDVWYIDDIEIIKTADAPEPDPDEPDPGEGRLGWLEVNSLKDAYASKFKVGNIMSPAQLSDTDLVEAFTHHFNVVTAENHMKPNQLSSAKGTYSFTQADTLVNWAQANNLEIHAHTLVWHSQSPNWLYRDSNGNPLTRAEAKANMEEYINTVAGHFAGKVVTWDVVNEAFDEGSWNASSGWQNNLRTNSPWYQAYSNGMADGETPGDYIYDAFVLTRLADPNAILLYNDYNDHLNPRRSAIVAMANDLNARWKNDERNTDKNRPLIEGVGMQAHYWVDEYNSLINNVRTALNGYSAAGLKIYITELDIPAGGSTSNWGTRTATEQDKERQPVMYENLFKLLQEYDAIERVTFWGMKDDLSWRGPNGTGLAEPLIFDNKRRAKPAFDAIMNVRPGSNDPVEILAMEADGSNLNFGGRISASSDISVSVNGTVITTKAPLSDDAFSIDLEGLVDIDTLPQNSIITLSGLEFTSPSMQGFVFTIAIGVN